MKILQLRSELDNFDRAYERMMSKNKTLKNSKSDDGSLVYITTLGIKLIYDPSKGNWPHVYLAPDTSILITDLDQVNINRDNYPKKSSFKENMKQVMKDIYPVLKNDDFTFKLYSNKNQETFKTYDNNSNIFISQEHLDYLNNLVEKINEAKQCK